MKAAPRPNFFIIGAFKCGTTAMYQYLRQHPQVFMPFHKEPLFFGEDLTRRYGRLTHEEYLALFRDARPGMRVGEASAWYLYSRSAAREIRDFAPDAQIIVMLRNPVDVMYAQHSQLLFNAQENLAGFAEALDAEPDRHRGERIPPGPVRLETLFYRASVRFAEQLQRYYDVFPKERIHVIVYEDFRDRTGEVYRQALDFLGVDPAFSPSFSIANPNKRVRFPRLQHLIYQPPAPLLRAVPGLRRHPIVHRLRDAVVGLNSSARRRAPMDPSLRRLLLLEQQPEVERLGHLIDRDLSSWFAEPEGLSL